MARLSAEERELKLQENRDKHAVAIEEASTALYTALADSNNTPGSDGFKKAHADFQAAVLAAGAASDQVVETIDLDEEQVAIIQAADAATRQVQDLVASQAVTNKKVDDLTSLLTQLLQSQGVKTPAPAPAPAPTTPERRVATSPRRKTDTGNANGSNRRTGAADRRRTV